MGISSIQSRPVINQPQRSPRPQATKEQENKPKMALDTFESCRAHITKGGAALGGAVGGIVLGVAAGAATEGAGFLAGTSAGAISGTFVGSGVGYLLGSAGCGKD